MLAGKLPEIVQHDSARSSESKIYGVCVIPGLEMRFSASRGTELKSEFGVQFGNPA